MKKEDIQPILDEMVDYYKQKKKTYEYAGVNIEQFSKDELIALLSEIGDKLKHYT